MERCDIGLQLLCGAQDLTRPFSSPNCSNNEEVRICPVAQTLFNVQPISRVLEVEMISTFYLRKMRQLPRTFIIEVCSNYDVINYVSGRQEDKNCHQVKMWPPIHQLVNKSIVMNFGL
jgi:uncharacterized protein (DUF1499 family)